MTKAAHANSGSGLVQTTTPGDPDILSGHTGQIHILEGYQQEDKNIPGNWLLVDRRRGRFYSIPPENAGFEDLPGMPPGYKRAYIFPGAEVLLTERTTPSPAVPELTWPKEGFDNGGFENNPDGYPWAYRCHNHVVAGGGGHSGDKFLCANNHSITQVGSVETVAQPSISQGVWTGYTGHFKLEFSICIRSEKVDGRKIKLVIWHYEPMCDPKWRLVAQTEESAVTENWQLYKIDGSAGAELYRCEVYWHDDEEPCIYFDDASCLVWKL